MSLFIYGDLEKEVDFTDVYFIEEVEKANTRMQTKTKSIPVTGKKTDLVKRQIEILDAFFEDILGEGASKLMFGDSGSALKRAQAFNALQDLSVAQNSEVDSLMSSFRPKKDRQKPNAVYNPKNRR